MKGQKTEVNCIVRRFVIQVFENGAQNIWTKMDEVMGEWRELHNEELHILY
jgi:hypothetical protein